jgi:hypothetical protein
VASWSFVESTFCKHGYFKIAQSGYSFYFRNKLKWHPLFSKVSLTGIHPKNHCRIGSFVEKEGETKRKNYIV